MKQAIHLLESIPAIENLLGYSFKDPALLFLAFVHRSYVNEDKAVTKHNERLEFLGDSVLGLLIAEHLFKQLPDTPEGHLSSLRSRLVDANSCVGFLKKLGIDGFILLGKGEQANDGKGRDSILADLFEAIIGAIFLDGGIKSAHKFLFTHFSEQIDEIIKMPLQNWKAILQDYCQKKYQKPPTYVVLNESGPDHVKIFNISVQINSEQLGQGMGSSKKAAQQSAAENAVANLLNMK